MKRLDCLLTLLSVPALAATGYLFTLSVFSARKRPKSVKGSNVRFDIVVPAHDEAANISKTVESLLALDYPKDQFRVVVIADNCTDDTKERSEEAGATVLVRNDPSARGKGYALAFAFDRLEEGGARAVVVIDADTLVSPNLLESFAALIEQGALAVQADYAVRNVGDSWRTRLMAIALGMFHVVRSAGRERLGLSCGLRGNGMCFTYELLQRVPHQAYSIVEDLEYGIRLGQAGVRVHYAGEAHVYGEMVSTEKASRSQRTRWEGGRKKLAREQGLELLASGLRRRDPVLVDLALDLLVPPLSTVGLWVAVGLASSALHAGLAGKPTRALRAWGTSAVFLGGYVMRGWQVSGTGVRGLVDLACSPAYILWKLSLKARRRASTTSDWVRTTREPTPSWSARQEGPAGSSPTRVDPVDGLPRTNQAAR